MNRIEYQGVDHYEAQLVWVRIFESMCMVASKHQVPPRMLTLEAETWRIYESLKKSAN